MPKYAPSEELQAIADELVNKHHTHLVGVRIVVVLRDKAANSNGRSVAGKARKVTGLNAYLAWPGEDRDRPPLASESHDYDFFVIEVADDLWRRHIDEDDDGGARWITALIDHELCHLERDFDTDALSIAPHDIEEFNVIARRHGDWSGDLGRLTRVLEDA